MGSRFPSVKGNASVKQLAETETNQEHRLWVGGWQLGSPCHEGLQGHLQVSSPTLYSTHLLPQLEN